MKKVLILCRRDDRAEYDTQETMLAAVGSVPTKAEYFGANYEDLLFEYDGDRLQVTDTVSGTDVAEYDAVFLIGWFKSKILDDTARAVAHYLHSRNVPFANSEAFYGRSFSKLSQVVVAALNGVRVTPFVFSIDPVILRAAIKRANLGSPYIVKAVVASRGNDNYLIAEESQLDVIDKVTEPPKFFIAQQFIPNDGDYRIIAMGGKVRRVIHRKASGESHLNNTSKGGAATLVDVEELPLHVIENTLNLARLFRREVTGIDMIKHRETGEYYFLEANNMPQLGTGSLVSEKITALDDYLNDLIDGTAVRYMD